LLIQQSTTVSLRPKHMLVGAVKEGAAAVKRRDANGVRTGSDSLRQSCGECHFKGGVGGGLDDSVGPDHLHVHGLVLGIEVSDVVDAARVAVARACSVDLRDAPPFEAASPRGQAGRAARFDYWPC